MLHIKKFSKGYHGEQVIRIDELHLSRGIHWIKGENGSGKTTFFKSLAGLLPHDGEIQFDDGISLKDNPVDYRKLVNYGEAEPVFPGFLTAKDLIHFIGNAKGSDKDQRQQLVTKFGIDSFYDKACETYSSGMMKKLSLVLAFLGNPKLIILDEPLITLDEKARTVLFDQINDSIRHNGTTFLISSHQLIENKALHINAIYSIQNKTISQD